MQAGGLLIQRHTHTHASSPLLSKWLMLMALDSLRWLVIMHSKDKGKVKASLQNMKCHLNYMVEGTYH